MKALPCICLSILLLVFIGCNSMTDVQSDTKLGGKTASKTVIYVPKTYTFGKNIIPAGTYRPAIEDNDGVYYQASSRVTIDTTIVGDVKTVGGLYFKFKSPNTPLFYGLIETDYGLDRMRKKIPSGFKYQKR